MNRPSTPSVIVLLIAVLITLTSQVQPAQAGKSNDHYLLPGERFTVVCTGGSTLAYGISLDHNGNPIAVKGLCVPAGQRAPIHFENVQSASYQ
jgi:hypothetical protein